MKYLREETLSGFFNYTTSMIHPENDQKYTGLNVNKGVAQPPSVNPYLKRRRRGN